MTCARLFAAGIILLLAAGDAAAQLRARRYVSGFTAPLAFVQDPTNSALQYVVEKGGRIRVIRNGAVDPVDFLDLSALVSTNSERGLLGLAFAPDYATSGRLFVNYTNVDGHTVIARFLRDTNNPASADPTSWFPLQLSEPAGAHYIEQPYANHNGGSLEFGPDGYLYIGMGDGGSSGDPENRAQNPATLLGKMLRIDVDVSLGDTVGYRIPPDNPFVDGSPVSARPEIWSFGLRNPFKFSFDMPSRGGDGALYIADVGQSAREEINREPSGSGERNYGWPLREGLSPFDGNRSAAYVPLTDPIHDYPRGDGHAITGGYVYRGTRLGPSYRGRYFFGDFVSGRVWSLALTAGGTVSSRTDHTSDLTASGSLGNVVSFGLDAQGEIYIVSFSGTVYKMEPACTITVSGLSILTFPGAGGTTSASVSADPGCTWSIDSSAPWLTAVVQGSTARLTAAQNTGTGPRTATVRIGSRTLTVRQAGAAARRVPAGDINLDGHGDLVWQNDGDGSLVVWEMSGLALADSAYLSPSSVSDPDWKIRATADLNGDGHADLIWQHRRDGWLVAWLMRGRTLVDSVYLQPNRVPDTAWAIVGAGDIDGDGRTDLVWQHQTGGWLVVWLMDGVRLLDSVEVIPNRVADTRWKIRAVADVDGDGFLDFVWQDTVDGWLVLWRMAALTLVDSIYLDPSRVADPSWVIVAAGDFNADGAADLIWRHSGDGSLIAWLMRGSRLLDSTYLRPAAVPDSRWRIVGPR